MRAGRSRCAIAQVDSATLLSPKWRSARRYCTNRWRFVTSTLQRNTAARKTLEHHVELFPEDDFREGLLLKVPRTDDSGQK
jgi:RNA binding exosome subunit